MTKKLQPISDHKPLELKPRDYQPGKAEREEKHDMPRLSLDQVKKIFMRPFRFSKKTNL